MEHNFNKDSFDQLLKESSDQYRMYPAERVWQNIFRMLHARKRWFGIGLILLLLSVGFVSSIMLWPSTNVATPLAPSLKELSAIPHIKEVAKNDKQIGSLLALYKNNSSIRDSQLLISPTIPLSSVTLLETTASNNTPKAETILEAKTTNEHKINITNDIIINLVSKNAIIPQPAFAPISDDAYDQNLYFGISSFHTSKPTAFATIVNANAQYPFTIESIINSYIKNSKKISLLYYFTPTVSYRKLSENKSYLRSSSYNSGSAALYYDINNVVTHKPDMGLEVGVAAQYTLNKRLKMRAGIQLNTSQYDIKAFKYSTEIATITLNTNKTTPDSLNTLSNYRNFNGYKSDWLRNLYFQVAIPIGLEFVVTGHKKTSFGIASTIQPTYIIGDKAYLISSNYKNYAKVPSLIRKWNANVGFEAFVSYSTDRMKWQIGPQLRYQLLSSFVKAYPIQEHLFDFGLKIGISTDR